MTSSGSATCARRLPASPGCLPLRPPPRRGVAGFLPNPSTDGGVEEFDESAPNRASSSATRAASPALIVSS